MPSFLFFCSRGGQSALRFARLRLEKRKNYIRKVAELAQQLLIDPATNQPNVAGIVCAGAADFKQKLQNDANFDPRLKKVVIKTIDVSYGGENGFSQAIEQVMLLHTVGAQKIEIFNSSYLFLFLLHHCAGG